MIAGLLLGFAVGAAIFGALWLTTLHRLSRAEEDRDATMDILTQLLNDGIDPSRAAQMAVGIVRHFSDTCYRETFVGLYRQAHADWRHIKKARQQATTSAHPGEAG